MNRVIVAAWLVLGAASALEAAPLPKDLPPAPGKPGVPPLAHFRFDGDATDQTRANPDFELKNTEFRQNALHLNGIYDGGNAGGYRAVCKTPAFDYTAFTVALRLKVEDFPQRTTN